MEVTDAGVLVVELVVELDTVVQLEEVVEMKDVGEEVERLVE